MKHIFVVNPASGKENYLPIITEQLRAYDGKIDYEIYTTLCTEDATRFVDLRASETDETIRFYSCGGDGTLNEVVNGAFGHKNAQVAVIPSGSGNDFVKYFGGKDKFTIDSLLNGHIMAADAIDVNGRVCINICNFGFDTEVAKTIDHVRRSKLFGKHAYTVGVIKALFTAMRNKCRVVVDGECICERDFLLCTLGNGSYVGGSYNCSPRSVIDDGLMEVCFVKPLSIFTFVKLIKSYSNGTHLDEPKFSKYLIYRRAKEVVVDAPVGFAITIDGEIVDGTHFEIKIMNKCINVVVPDGAVIKNV